MTKEGDILLNYFINFGDNAAYSIIDGNDYDKNVYLKSYAPIEVKGCLYNFSAHPMSENTEGDIHFIMPLCDTVFVYSDKGNYYLCSIPKDPVKIPIINIVGSTDHEFIGTFTATDLITFYSDMEKNNRGGIFRKLEKIVENLDEESNPFLVFYAFE